MSKVTQFSTAAAQPAQSLSLWKQQMAEVYYRLDITTKMPSEIMRGALAMRDAESTRFSFMATSTANRVIRSKELAASDSEELHVLVAPTRGVFSARQRGREVVAKPGDLYVLNSSEYYEVDIPANGEILVGCLPTVITRQHFRDLNDYCCSERFADKMLSRVFADFCRSALWLDTNLPPERVRDLFLAILSAVSASKHIGTGSLSPELAAFSRFLIPKVRHLVSRNMANPDYDINRAAASCGVSVRYLQMAFRDAGTTFTKLLLETRLAGARVQLMEASTRLSVGQIAEQSGFRTLSNFSTCYRKRYGRSPRDDRNS